MTPTPEDLAAVPERLRLLYGADPAKWGGAVISTARQLAGQPPLPPLHEQVANFAGAVVSHVASGLQVVSPEEAARRLSICDGCEHYRKADNRCSLCGCGLSLKTTWASSSCPVGKW